MSYTYSKHLHFCLPLYKPCIPDCLQFESVAWAVSANCKLEVSRGFWYRFFPVLVNSCWKNQHLNTVLFFPLFCFLLYIFSVLSIITSFPCTIRSKGIIVANQKAVQTSVESRINFWVTFCFPWICSKGKQIPFVSLSACSLCFIFLSSSFQRAALLLPNCLCFHELLLMLFLRKKKKRKRLSLMLLILWTPSVRAGSKDAQI